MSIEEVCSQAIRNDATSPEYEEAPRLSFGYILESTQRDTNRSNCKSSSSIEEEEALMFEFFSAHSGLSFEAPPTTHPPENIILWGKKMTPDTSSKKKNSLKKKVLKWLTPSSSSSSPPPSKHISKNRRWWMVMFGSMRVPNEMELSDIKSRQKRRPPQAVKAFVAMFDDYQQQTSKSQMGAKTSSSINGLIGLVRSLSCRH